MSEWLLEPDGSAEASMATPVGSHVAVVQGSREDRTQHLCVDLPDGVVETTIPIDLLVALLYRAGYVVTVRG